MKNGEREKMSGHCALADRPDERCIAACSRPHPNGNVAAAAGGQPLEQSFQHFCAGRMIVADIGHQLPALLDDFEMALGRADLGGIVLRIEQRAQEGRKLLCRAAPPGQPASSGPNNCTNTGAAVFTYSIA